MHMFRISFAAISAAVLLPVAIAQTDRSVSGPKDVLPSASVSDANKSLNKCPKHYSKHKDDLGAVWCMDASGRSYTPENARYVAKTEGKKSDHTH